MALARLASRVCFSLLSSVIFVPPGFTGQQSAVANSPRNTPSTAAQDDSVHVLYTGKLLGYFRVPDGQVPDGTQVCPHDEDKRPSLAAQSFHTLMADQQFKNVVLVGMGDNFAPEVEARKFCVPPLEEVNSRHQYRRLGKEFFEWNGSHWVTVRGTGRLPFDNV